MILSEDSNLFHYAANPQSGGRRPSLEMGQEYLERVPTDH
jgi:hypothetical protein